MKLLSTRKAYCIAFAVIFLFMLVCNCLTPYQADDFYYHFRVDNGEPMDSIADIIPSMIAHAEVLNGRLVAHSLVQLFEMPPKLLFNFVNSAVFMLLLVLMCRLVGFGELRQNAVALALVFGALWVFTPAVGEVYLWLDGSINYLWAMVFNLAFLLPYLRLFDTGEAMTPLWKKILFVIFAFLCGAFQETASTAAFLVAVVFMLLARHTAVGGRRRVGRVYIAGAAAAFAGLLFMATRSAELGVKSSSESFVSLYIGFGNMMSFFLRFAPGIGLFVVALVLCLVHGADKKRVVVASVFFLGFMCANGVMVLARIYPDRCACPALIFLVMANAVLLRELARLKYKVALTCFAALLCTSTLYFSVLGVADITSTFAQFKVNEASILTAIGNGEDEVLLPQLYATTKYSVAYSMIFPSTIDWVNDYLAQYYGIDHILGYDFYTEVFHR